MQQNEQEADNGHRSGRDEVLVGPDRHSAVFLHESAVFYHESAAFHHRQAAQYLGVGQVSSAQRHIWAAFGHSLNAHEATRESVAKMNQKGDESPGEDGAARAAASPAADGPDGSKAI